MWEAYRILSQETDTAASSVDAVQWNRRLFMAQSKVTEPIFFGTVWFIHWGFLRFSDTQRMAMRDIRLLDFLVKIVFCYGASIDLFLSPDVRLRYLVSSEMGTTLSFLFFTTCAFPLNEVLRVAHLPEGSSFPRANWHSGR